MEGNTIMSKATISTVLVLVALCASGWAVLLGTVAPYGDNGAGAFAVFAAAGIASLAAATIAFRQPCQFVVMSIASVLAVGHIFLWCWIALIAFKGL